MLAEAVFIWSQAVCEVNESKWSACCRDLCYWEAEPEGSSCAVVITCSLSVCSGSMGTNCLA